MFIILKKGDNMANKITMILLILSASAFCLTLKKLYFTTNTLSTGTSVKPGFTFNYTFNAVGTAKNGHQFVGFGDTDEGVAAGDVCIVEYDPYANTMSSPGTITEAYARAGNRVSGEYCNKVHTWLCGTPDGRLWMGSQDGGRGGHLLYVDTRTGVLTDYSRTQKYIYLANPAAPVLNHPELAPGSANGIAIQNKDFVSMNINPLCPRYIWTNSYTNFYFHCWDLEADTTYAYPGGNANTRVHLVDRQGNLWYSMSGFAYKRSPRGTLKMAGRGLITDSPGGSAFVFTHSYDSAFTVGRTTGEIELYDFVRDTVTSFLNMPDGTSGHQHYRSITVSRDGRLLFTIGDGGNLYQINIATRQYQVLQNINAYLPGDYAFGSGNMDTLGNWYICCRGNSEKYLLQINLGKDLITQLPIPAPAGVENLRLVSGNAPAFTVQPNPFGAQVAFLLSEKDLVLRVFDPAGRLVWSPRISGNTATWNAAEAPAGSYVAVAKNGKGAWSRILIKQ